MTATALALGRETTDEELKAVSDGFEGARPEAVLGWAFEEFGDEVALATGFGAEGCVLVDALARVRPGARIFYLDTELLFPETYALVERLSARYGVRFERRATRLSLEAQAGLYGERLWERDPGECCRLRKVEPLREVLAGLRAWVTAIRREQTPARSSASSRSTRSPPGRRATCGTTSRSTTCRTTRSTTKATLRSAVRRAPRPCASAKARAPGAGAGR